MGLGASQGVVGWVRHPYVATGCTPVSIDQLTGERGSLPSLLGVEHEVLTMAQNPVGTITDEERLVPLYTSQDRFLVDVTEPVRSADLPEVGPFAWRLREEGDVDRLALAPVEGPDDVGALPTRELSDGSIEVPEGLLAELDIEKATYDDDNPLLFEPDELDDGLAVGMERDGEPAGTAEPALELAPVRFADGTPYDADPIAEESLDSDPVAKETVAHEGGVGAPWAETMSAPIDAPVLEEVLVSRDVPRSDVVEALETIARRGLVTEGDNEGDSRPLAVDDRAVVGLEDETWRTKVAAALDADEEVLEAVRELHARQAETLLGRSDAGRRRFEGRTPVVVQPDRHYDTAAQPE